LIIFLILLGGLLSIPAFYFARQLVFYWLNRLSHAKALANSSGPTALNVADAADGKPAIDRFEDDGGKQYL
jgi:hypothetical protein